MSFCRAKPSQLDNVIEIEVSHHADRHAHRVVEAVIFDGIRRLSLKTKDPASGPTISDPRAYMKFEYETGKVVDHNTEMSRRSHEGDELMVDVIKISFEKKTFTACVWDAGYLAPETSV